MQDLAATLELDSLQVLQRVADTIAEKETGEVEDDEKQVLVFTDGSCVYGFRHVVLVMQEEDEDDALYSDEEPEAEESPEEN